MEKRINILVVLIFSLYFIKGCSSSDCIVNNKDYYKIETIIGFLFQDYYFIYVTDSKKNDYYLLSRKETELQAKPFREFNKIEKGNCYKMELVKIDTLMLIKGYPKKSHGEDFSVGNTLVWENDTIKAEIYMSPDIFDQFIKK